MGFVAYVLSILGCGCLALSLQQHWRGVFARNLEKRAKWSLRAAGWGLLGVAFACCTAWWGTAIGIAAWLGTLTLSAISVAILLTYGNAVLRRQRVD